jgi:hypothetical protein
VQAASYTCPKTRRLGCVTGSTSHRLADPIIGAALELRLGDRETRERLIYEAGLEADRRASALAKTLPSAGVFLHASVLLNSKARAFSPRDIAK